MTATVPGMSRALKALLFCRSLVPTPLLDNTIYIVRALLWTSQHVAEFLLQAFSDRVTDEWEARRNSKTWD